MPSQPSLVDRFGDLSIHMLQDLVVPVRGGDTLPDISGRSLVFYIPKRGIRHVLGDHPFQATWKIISMTAEELRTVRTGDEFILMDETDEAQPLWEGSIRRRGV